MWFGHGSTDLSLLGFQLGVVLAQRTSPRMQGAADAEDRQRFRPGGVVDLMLGKAGALRDRFCASHEIVGDARLGILIAHAHVVFSRDHIRIAYLMKRMFP
jgi:hypothetical protein